MNDLPRQKLCELIAQHGPTLCEDSRRCNTLLKEQCGTFKKKVRILVGALEEQVTDELLTAPADAPRPDLLDRLRKQLQEAVKGYSGNVPVRLQSFLSAKFQVADLPVSQVKLAGAALEH